VGEVMERCEVTVARWIATVHYRMDAGLVDVSHDLLELDELHDIVERGPHWDAIDHIDIVRADGAEQALTVEQAARL
jgi:hypothetical protein